MAYNFNQICRLCMRTDVILQNIFAETENLCARIEELSPELQISVGDGLPTQVCQECVQQLQGYSNFRLQCEKSDVTLRQQLSIKNTQVIDGLELQFLEAKPEIVPFISEELKQELASSNETEYEEQMLEENNEDLNKEIESLYKCSTCSEVFLSKESQEQHKCSTSYECQICMKVLASVTELCNHMLCHEKEPCRVCGKSFKDKRYYLAHVRAHSGIGYKCADCGRLFAFVSLYNIHRRIHTGEKRYICEFCGKMFVFVNHYQSHVRKHTGEKPYECPVCMKRFSVKLSLQRHIRTHTGEKPYVCEVCGKSFNDPSSIWKHSKTVHGQKQRNHKCSVCYKEYVRGSELKYHMRSHTGERPYECHLCGKKFMIRNSLNIHIKIHEGKTFDCAVCKKSFSTSTSRDRHMRTHTGETPFGCATCDKAFSLRRDLVKHVFKFQH